MLLPRCLPRQSPATPSPGTNPGTTKVTAAAGTDNHLVTKVSSSLIPTPNAGDPVPTGAGVTDPYTPGTEISGVDAVTNKYIGVYEVDSSNKIVSFKLITLTSGDIRNDVPTAAGDTVSGNEPWNDESHGGGGNG
ncbi:hypothetical protein LJK87_43755 [Paenibacillus sp. P25]|nr:hypothetical protein LJK87_43755 [Paenibacillus sp. P25]